MAINNLVENALGGIGKGGGGATAAGLLPSVMKLFGFADGGFVSGRGSSRSDSIPARLSNGEFVVNAKATRLNRPLLEAINSGVLAKLAAGGPVSRLNPPTGLAGSEFIVEFEQ